MVSSKNIKLIDFHVHCFPDEVAVRAFAKFRDTYGFEPLAPGTVADLLHFMDQAGIDLTIPQPVATKSSQVEGINNWAISIRSDRIIPFGAMHPDYPKVGEGMDWLVANGFNGIKLQPNWQGFYPDDERAFPIYEAAEGRLAVLFHAGREARDEDEEIFSTATRLLKVHKRFPGMKMIIAHMGGYQCWDESHSILAEADVSLDMSYCPKHKLDDEKLVRLIRAYGSNRIIFGSDFPFANPVDSAERLMSLPLTEEELENIAWKNAAAILGIS